MATRVTETAELPLFPLNVVLFPGGPLPLRIFETRYVDMVKKCMRDGTPFGVVCITDAATDFAVGDYFNVCVFNKLSGGKVVAWDPAPSSFDGREDVAGILFDAVNATSADTAGVIVARGAAVMKSALQWAAAITSAQKESAYADMAKQLGIIAR